MRCALAAVELEGEMGSQLKLPGDAIGSADLSEV
jgi:hypothetical protein